MADERKRRRMESNRESARRSRVKKQNQLQQAISDIDLFKRQNALIASRIEETKHRYLVVETEMKAMTAQKTDLEQRLGQLNSMIDKTEARDRAVLWPPIMRADSWSDFSKEGLSFGGGDDFDMLLSPWRSTVSAATMS